MVSAVSQLPPKNRPLREAALERLLTRLEIRGGTLASVVLAVVLHVAFFGAAIALVMLGELWDWQRGLLGRMQASILEDYQVDLIKEPEPEPPKEEVKEPEPEPPKAEEAPPPVAEKPTTAPQPQAAAQAAQVIAAQPDPNEVLDMSNVMIQGNAATYGGGTTSAAGTGTNVKGPAAATGGTATGTGATPAPPPGPSKARKAALSGGAEWDCPFPPEADGVQEDVAYVTIKVSVGLDGKPQKVTVLQDPGHGFGREARTCAMRKTFVTALDDVGSPIAGETGAIRVRFERQ